MKNTDNLKEIVNEKYSQLAGNPDRSVGCCGSSCGCSTADTFTMADDYSALKGYVPDADLGLGCGLPTEFAMLKAGDTVVDLGSGAGNDAFIARSVVGAHGKVIGVDMTEMMIERARTNAKKLEYSNVEFRLGDIENLPMASGIADVVVSNCVLNLVPDKKKAFAETFRILKSGGHFSVSDIVFKGKLPDSIRKSAEMYAGCVAGAIEKNEYLDIIRLAGFKNINVQSEKRIDLPGETLQQFLTVEELEEYSDGKSGIVSITVYGEKPDACCGPGCCN
ncbi:arsenite methyltransferase [Chryseolinea sp. T2]|uniref:arsenite methyltransferase n=1 Tax=Chryseolinea sp. T2 TaxID=3129255 RepID=UPI003077D272